MLNGKALDAKVGKEIMGVPFAEPVNDMYCHHCGAFADHSDKRCHYSIDDGAALAVVRKMAEKGYMVTIDPLWWATAEFEIVFSKNFTAPCRGEGTFPHAVCIAALRALGVEVDE